MQAVRGVVWWSVLERGGGKRAEMFDVGGADTGGATGAQAPPHGVVTRTGRDAERRPEQTFGGDGASARDCG